MMFRKWMIGICIAVAAMVAGEAVQAQGVYKAVEVTVNNKSAKPATITIYCTCGDNPCSCPEPFTASVAPQSSSAMLYEVEPGEEEDHRVIVKVKNMPAKKLTINAKEVKELMKKSGFTNGVHPAVGIRVNKFGIAEIGGVYLKKDVAP